MAVGDRDVQMDISRFIFTRTRHTHILALVCTNIMHLHKGQLIYYSGNYDTYVKTRAENETNQMKLYHKQQDEILAYG